MVCGALIGIWALPPVAAVDFWLVEAAAAALWRRRPKYHKTRTIIMITIMQMDKPIASPEFDPEFELSP